MRKCISGNVYTTVTKQCSTLGDKKWGKLKYFKKCKSVLKVLFKYFLFVAGIKEDGSEDEREEGHLGAQVRAPELLGHAVHG